MNTEIKRKINFSGQLEIKNEQGENKSRTIRGRAIVFNSPTTLYETDTHIYREEILPEAITEETLKDNDIVMTLYHNPERVLARAKKGQGTLICSVSPQGVDFQFDAPDTVDGDTALELVRKGIIDGCSFWAFLSEDQMDRITSEEDGKTVVTLRIKGFRKIKDLTLTFDPQYTQTEVETVIRSAGFQDKPDMTAEENIDYSESWEAIERESQNNIF